MEDSEGQGREGRDATRGILMELKKEGEGVVKGLGKERAQKKKRLQVLKV